jgi:outer membrane receptor protein involved in Fe transport
MGVRGFYNNRDQTYFFNTLNGSNVYERNNALSQDARISEMTNAAYITYSSRLKMGINYQLGMRFEQSVLDGRSNLDNTTFGFNYPKAASDVFKALFPSAYFSKKLSKTQEVQVNMSRKINRPNFMQLMPVIQNNDLVNVRRGNPALKPEFVNLMELNYNKLWKSNNWLLSLYGRIEEDPIVSITSLEGTTRVTQPENGTKGYRYGLDNTLKLGLVKDLELTTNLNVFNLNVQTAEFKTDGWAYNVKGNLNWKLPKKLKDFSMQLNASYESSQVIPQGERLPIFFMDYALKYTFNRVGSVAFQINDITNTRWEILRVNQVDFEQTSMRRRDLRFYKLTFQMPFGKMDASIFRRAKEGQRNQNNQNQMPDYGGN